MQSKGKNFFIAAAIMFLVPIMCIPAWAQGGGREGTGPEGRGESPPDAALREIQGRITETKTFDLAGIDEAHMFLKIENRQGEKTVVDMGPADKIGDLDLDLQEGDELTVHGLEGTVNGKPVFVAMQAGENGQKEIRQPYDLDLRRVQATVLRTRIASFKKHDVPDQLFARVEMTQDRETTVVNLGPVENFPRDMEIEDQQIVLLARRAKIRGKNALVAESVQFPGGEVIDVDWTLPEKRR